MEEKEIKTNKLINTLFERIKNEIDLRLKAETRLVFYYQLAKQTNPNIVDNYIEKLIDGGYYDE